MRILKTTFIGLVLSLMSLPAVAQEEMKWENVTALYFAATNGTDRNRKTGGADQIQGISL
ncbi:MAG: hypothetical protein IJ633_06950 [Prevotella sp.]|nr:hypothetical protein [Prevotella sp.]